MSINDGVVTLDAFAAISLTIWIAAIGLGLGLSYANRSEDGLKSSLVNYGLGGLFFGGWAGVIVAFVVTGVVDLLSSI